MITEIALLYLAAGCAVVWVGPVRRFADHSVSDMRGDEPADAFHREPAPPAWRRAAFRVILCTVLALLWPFALVSMSRQEAQKAREQRAWKARVSAGLEFSRMGGAGEVRCGACGFSERLISLIHGESQGGRRCGTCGYQCTACGRFALIRDEDGVPERPAVCGCGGRLSRDHVLFCPRCGSSRDLVYQMHFIT